MWDETRNAQENDQKVETHECAGHSKTKIDQVDKKNLKCRYYIYVQACPIEICTIWCLPLKRYEICTYKRLTKVRMKMWVQMHIAFILFFSYSNKKFWIRKCASSPTSMTARVVMLQVRLLQQKNSRDGWKIKKREIGLLIILFISSSSYNRPYIINIADLIET